MMPRTYDVAEIAALVRRVAPVWYLHDEEPYMPSSVDWYLARATQVSKTGERIVLAEGTGAPEDRLAQNDQWPFAGDSADYWLEVPEAAWAGNVASAKAYVSIRRVEAGFLDISFWFWYPGNGCGAARVRTLAFDTTVMTKERVPLTTLGFHVSDWEKITVRVADDADNRLEAVYFAQHGDGHWYTPDRLEFEPSGQFAVYASRNGHASYPTADTHYSAHIKTAPPGTWAKLTPAALEIWLRNDTNKGTRIDCATAHEIISIQDGADGITLSAQSGAEATRSISFGGRLMIGADGGVHLREPKWLNYPYRWGPETEQKITHEVVFEALKMAIGPLVVYGAMTLGMALPILGAVAGLLAPYYVKMETENGKPGPKVKYTAGGVIDAESPPEPDNLFHEMAGDGFTSMADWVQNAGSDAVNWTQGAAGSVKDWTVGAADVGGDWVVNTAGDAGNWFEGAAADTGHWFENAANDSANWVKGAVNDAGDWVEDSADDAIDWIKGAGNSVRDALRL